MAGTPTLIGRPPDLPTVAVFFSTYESTTTLRRGERYDLPYPPHGDSLCLSPYCLLSILSFAMIFSVNAYVRPRVLLPNSAEPGLIL